MYVCESSHFPLPFLFPSFLAPSPPDGIILEAMGEQSRVSIRVRRASHGVSWNAVLMPERSKERTMGTGVQPEHMEEGGPAWLGVSELEQGKEDILTEAHPGIG